MVVGLAVAGMTMGLLSPIINELLKPALYGLRYVTRFECPEPMALVEAYWRGYMDWDELCLHMNRLGFDHKHIRRYVDIVESYLSPLETISAYRRKIINEEQFYDIMRKLHFKKEQADLLLRVTEHYPTPATLIMWQAREVYEPEAVEKYGLDDELELIEKEPFYKAGFTDEQIRNYWRAHWVHPPWTIIIEMLHRGLITEKDVWEWFRLVEIPPYWRDRYIKIAYRPFTRVDVRRMYRVGVLDRDGVKRAYLDLGYDEDKAEKMTEFTIRYEIPREKELTEAKVRKAFMENKIDEETALKYLLAMGYLKESAELIIELWKDDKHDEMVEMYIEIAVMRYLTGQMTKEQFIDWLDGLELPTPTRNYILQKTLYRKEKMRKMPTKEDVINWFKLRIIDKKMAEKLLSDIGYADLHISWYLKEAML